MAARRGPAAAHAARQRNRFMPGFDTGVPHSVRVFDYWLGGKDNLAADRDVGDRAL